MPKQADFPIDELEADNLDKFGGDDATGFGIDEEVSSLRLEDLEDPYAVF